MLKTATVTKTGLAEISSKADPEKTQTMLSDSFVMSLFWMVICGFYSQQATKVKASFSAVLHTSAIIEWVSLHFKDFSLHV